MEILESNNDGWMKYKEYKARQEWSKKRHLELLNNVPEWLREIYKEREEEFIKNLEKNVNR